MKPTTVVMLLQTVLTVGYGFEDVNLMRSPAEVSVSCQASSSSSGYPCQATYDGNFAPGHGTAWAASNDHSGQWMSYSFGTQVWVQSIRVYPRCTIKDQYKGAAVHLYEEPGAAAFRTRNQLPKMEFPCDGVDQSGTNGEDVRNCIGQDPIILEFEQPILAWNVRFTFFNPCRMGKHPGLREVEIYGHIDCSACPHQVDESWSLKGITYDLDQAAVIENNPSTLASEIVENNSNADGKQTFTYSEARTDKSSYVYHRGVTLKGGLKFKAAIPIIVSGDINIELGGQWDNTWGEDSTETTTYTSSVEAQVKAHTTARMTVVIEKGTMNVPYTMTFERDGCECVSSGMWTGQSYYNRHTTITDITSRVRRALAGRTRAIHTSATRSPTNCGHGANGWECSSNGIKFIEFDAFSYPSHSVNTNTTMAGRTAAACFAECRADTSCVGVVRASSLAATDDGDCYFVSAADVAHCQLTDVEDRSYMVWIESGRDNNCGRPRKVSREVR